MMMMMMMMMMSAHFSYRHSSQYSTAQPGKTSKVQRSLPAQHGWHMRIQKLKMMVALEILWNS
jgi:hypothetical protein